FPKCAREAKVEAGVIDQHDCIRFGRVDLIQCPGELFPEIAGMFQNFPKADDRRGADPIRELIADDRFHLRTAASVKLAIRREIAEGSHQGRAMLVPAGFARDEVKSLSHAEPN
ncbi:MAG: hypothetical protein QOD64_318, partial [Verrucomicrobiota bacterium]